MYLAFTNENAKAYQLPISSLFLNWDNKGIPVQVLTYIHRFTLLRYVASFALMSAAGHFAALYYWDKYTGDLKKGMNRFRWYEYMISGSLIMTLLFIIWGNFDWTQAAGCFFSQALTMLFGDMMEVMNANKKKEDVDWTPYWYGSICGIVPWCVMIGELIRSPNLSDIPWFVWGFVIIYFLCFWCFPITMYRTFAQLGDYDNSLYPLLDNGGYL